MLEPGSKKCHRAFKWTYCMTHCQVPKAVVFDYGDGRGGPHARGFLGPDTNASKDGWHGKHVCDDFSGYNACVEPGVAELVYMPRFPAGSSRNCESTKAASSAIER